MRSLLARVPRLQQMATFEAAARLGSFTAAADELGMTQPAVTRQIRALERSVGMALFERTANSSTLSDAGRTFAASVDAAFATLEVSIAELTHEDGTVVIAAPPGFAQHLVVPYLESLQDALDGRDIRLWLYDRERDLNGGGYDVAIRIGRSGWPGYDEQRLFDEIALPVATPALATDLGLDASSSAADVLAAPLIHMEGHGRAWMSWSDWLAEFDLALTPSRRRVLYNTYPLVLQQAIAGRGVALGWRGIVDTHLADGVLVPVGPEVASSAHYSVAWPTAGSSAAVDTIVSWLLARTHWSSPDRSPNSESPEPSVDVD